MTEGFTPSWMGDMAADAQEVRAPSESDLSDLGQLIQAQRELEAAIEVTDALLAKQRADLAILSEVKIPEMFDKLGMRDIKMSDGAKVEVKPFYAASISEENKPAAFKWLRKEGLDDMIKHEVKVNYGKGEDALGKKLAKYLKRIKANYTDKESVHPSTLKAFVKQRIESGQPLPNETFGVHVGKKTKITPPKSK